jgi:hypothetical protein
MSRSTIYSDSFKEFESRLAKEVGEDIRVLANKIIVYRLYIRNYPKIETMDLPERVVSYLKEDFARILKPSKESKNTFLTFQHSQFSKYIDTLYFNLLPLGGQGVVETGFPRSLMFKQSVPDMFKFSILLAGLGGNRPFFEMHYNEHRFRQFNPDGWNSVLQIGTELLLRRSGVKGIVGSAWFFDPQIETVSPELKYIRELVLKIGGHIFFADKSEKDKKNAFAMSLARKRAYEEGRYEPASYIAIIPRKSLLRYYGV